MPAARASIQSYVSNLRRLLGSVGVDPRTVLANAPPGYRLTVADGACDLGRFITEKTAGVRAAAAGRFEQASSHLSAALAEWRGPVLDDLRDFAFVEALATALVEDKLMPTPHCAEAEIACGRADTVIGELEALAAEHPYREPLWAQLITAYYVAERQSDALEAYRRLKTTLAEDLGIDPGPTLSALHERILRQEPLDTKRPPRPPPQARLTPFASAPRSRPVRRRLAARHCRTPLSAASRSHPDRARFRQRHRARRRRRQPPPRRHHRHRNRFHDHGFAVGQRRRSAGPANPHQRHPADGDHIRIGSHEFIFEIRGRKNFASVC